MQTVLNTSARSTINRVYTETNITVSKLEAVSNYLLACYHNETGFFTSRPPRQDLNEFYDDVNDLPTPSDLASVRVYKALSALDRSHLHLPSDPSGSFGYASVPSGAGIG